jgi:limonene-1,2-epoxide hydrolase
VNVLNEERIVREVFEMWSAGKESTKESWRKHASPEIIWWNSGRGTLEGRTACEAAIDAIFDTLKVSSVKVPIRNIAAVPGLVFIERSDDFYLRDGSFLVSIPVTGVVQFQDDTIVEWRDYCDDWMRDYRVEGAERTLA